MAFSTLFVSFVSMPSPERVCFTNIGAPTLGLPLSGDELGMLVEEAGGELATAVFFGGEFALEVLVGTATGLVFCSCGAADSVVLLLALSPIDVLEDSSANKGESIAFSHL